MEREIIKNYIIGALALLFLVFLITPWITSYHEEKVQDSFIKEMVDSGIFYSTYFDCKTLSLEINKTEFIEQNRTEELKQIEDAFKDLQKQCRGKRILAEPTNLQDFANSIIQQNYDVIGNQFVTENLNEIGSGFIENNLQEVKQAVC